MKPSIARTFWTPSDPGGRGEGWRAPIEIEAGTGGSGREEVDGVGFGPRGQAPAALRRRPPRPARRGSRLPRPRPGPVDRCVALPRPAQPTRRRFVEQRPGGRVEETRVGTAAIAPARSWVAAGRVVRIAKDGGREGRGRVVWPAGLDAAQERRSLGWLTRQERTLGRDERSGSAASMRANRSAGSGAVAEAGAGETLPEAVRG